jgi:glycogen operon protein
MISFRKAHPVLRKGRFFTGVTAKGFSAPDISWHGKDAGSPEWGNGCSRIGMLLNGAYMVPEGRGEDLDLYIIFNASPVSGYFRVPAAPSGKAWRVAVDTALPGPLDIRTPGTEAPLDGDRYFVKKISTVVMVASG